LPFAPASAADDPLEFGMHDHTRQTISGHRQAGAVEAGGQLRSRQVIAVTEGSFDGRGAACERTASSPSLPL
jgi:hypothetical protein